MKHKDESIKIKQDKREANIRLKEYFEAEMGRDLYEVVEKESFKP